MDNHGNYFRSLGIKKIILKFLTKVETLDVSHHKDFMSIRDFVENEYCIPKHLQIYMLYNVEIDSNKALTKTFFDYSQAEEKTLETLTLNLIAKPPNTLQINICCPYFRFKVSKIGLPDMIEMVETSTLADVEIEGFVGVRNTVFPSKFSLNPGIPDIKKTKSRHRHIS